MKTIIDCKLIADGASVGIWREDLTDGSAVYSLCLVADDHQGKRGRIFMEMTSETQARRLYEAFDHTITHAFPVI